MHYIAVLVEFRVRRLRLPCINDLCEKRHDRDIQLRCIVVHPVASRTRPAVVEPHLLLRIDEDSPSAAEDAHQCLREKVRQIVMVFGDGDSIKVFEDKPDPARHPQVQGLADYKSAFPSGAAHCLADRQILKRIEVVGCYKYAFMSGGKFRQFFQPVIFCRRVDNAFCYPHRGPGEAVIDPEPESTHGMKLSD